MRLEPTVYEVCSFRLEGSSVTSVTVQGAFNGGVGIPPRQPGTAGNDTASAPEGGTVYRGATNLVGLTAGLCGLPTREGIVPDQLQRTDREKDHARRGKRHNTSHRRK
jgi:hypothetical protein